MEKELLVWREALYLPLILKLIYFLFNELRYIEISQSLNCSSFLSFSSSPFFVMGQSEAQRSTAAKVSSVARPLATGSQPILIAASVESAAAHPLQQHIDAYTVDLLYIYLDIATMLHIRFCVLLPFFLLYAFLKFFHVMFHPSLRY